MIYRFGILPKAVMICMYYYYDLILLNILARILFCLKDKASATISCFGIVPELLYDCPRFLQSVPTCF